MEKFKGFPPGELRFTSVPDLFFAKLLPQIDDLIELKVILHVLWLRQRDHKQIVSLAELQSDETLIAGLTAIAPDPFEALQHGLQSGIQRDALLHAEVESDDGPHQLYFLNSEGGRIALKKVQSGEMGVVATTGADLASPDYAQRPNIFELYEANIGLLSPILADELKDAEMTYPPGWVEEAFKIAVENNVRKWSYIRAVLEGMAAEGKEQYGKNRQDTQKDSRRWYTDEEFNTLIQH